MWAEALLVALLAVGGGRGEERWARGPDAKASSIPGYVEPTTTTTTTTTTPPVTTFRPPFHRPLGRASPLFLGPFEPFSVRRREKAKSRSDGTTKSRAAAVDAFGAVDGGAPLDDAVDKYTTLDRLQRERGSPPPFPPPEARLLGGLRPEEVFYADEDLLIIRGGGFGPEATFEEPRQPLEEEEEEEEEGGSYPRVSSVMAPLPSPDEEYNGNIPAIVPPPNGRRGAAPPRPLSLFAGRGSHDAFLLVPYFDAASAVKNNVRRSATPYVAVFPPPYITHRPSGAAHHPNALRPHSLAGDTRVNYAHPRPPVNPDAERVEFPLISLRHRQQPPYNHHNYHNNYSYYPGKFRRQERPRV